MVLHGLRNESQLVDFFNFNCMSCYRDYAYFSWNLVNFAIQIQIFLIICFSAVRKINNIQKHVFFFKQKFLSKISLFAIHDFRWKEVRDIEIVEDIEFIELGFHVKLRKFQRGSLLIGSVSKAFG